MCSSPKFVTLHMQLFIANPNQARPCGVMIETAGNKIVAISLEWFKLLPNGHRKKYPPDFEALNSLGGVLCRTPV